MKTTKKFGTHSIQLPNGRWGFVGHVPAHLAYVKKDGSKITDQEHADIQSFGAGLFRKTITTRTWDTQAEADLAKKNEKL